VDLVNHHIVIGIDHAAGGERAAATGAQLSRDLRREAVLVHVLRARRAGFRGAVSIGVGHEVRRLRAIVNEHGLPSGTRVALCRGDPAEALINFTKADDAELMAVGSRGLHELGDAVLGSVSSTLMRTAPCPVVVAPPAIRPPVAPMSLRPVVCGVEGSDRDQESLRLAADLARRLGSELHAVHACSPRPVALGAAPVTPPVMPDLTEAAEATLERAVADAGVKARKCVVPSPAKNGLLNLADDLDAGLLVIGSQGRGRLGSALLGSVAIQLTAESRIPVVVLPAGALLEGGSGHYEVADVVA
jgi:nucleotide-binding universal stress UspA family protein